MKSHPTQVGFVFFEGAILAACFYALKSPAINSLPLLVMASRRFSMR